MQFKGRNLVQLDAERAGGVGPAGRPARARDHRIRAAAGRGHTLGAAASAARVRRAHFDGRFRHRLFVARLSAQLSVRQDQDRPLLRPRHAGAQGLPGHRARRRRARAQPRHHHHHRRHRDQGAARWRPRPTAATRGRAICSPSRCPSARSPASSPNASASPRRHSAPLLPSVDC